MRELLVNTRDEAGADGHTYRYDYSILVDQMELADGFACESYGVKIADRSGGGEISIPNITTSASRIDELLDLLARNTVTPATAMDVVQDWL